MPIIVRGEVDINKILFKNINNPICSRRTLMFKNTVSMRCVHSTPMRDRTYNVTYETTRSLKWLLWRSTSGCIWILRSHTSVMNAASGLAAIVTSLYTCARTWAISLTLATCVTNGSYIAASWRYTDGSIQVRNRTRVAYAASRSLKSVLWLDISGFTRTLNRTRVTCVACCSLKSVLWRDTDRNTQRRSETLDL